MSELPSQPVPPGPSAPAVAWPAIFAGAAVAMATTTIFVALGAGFSVGSLAAWPNLGRGLTAFSAITGVWLIVAQWVSSGVGGYLAGRLRTRWHGLHTHEVFFRDTANGLITWAVATLVVAALGALVASLTPVDAVAATGHLSTAAVDAGKKAAAAFSVFTGISMLVGAFVACVAAALGGQQRDEHG